MVFMYIIYHMLMIFVIYQKMIQHVQQMMKLNYLKMLYVV